MACLHALKPMKLEAALNMLFRCIGDAVTGMKRKCSSDKLDSETYQAWNFAAHGLVNSLLHGHGESHSRPNLRSNLSNRSMTVFAMNPQFLSHMFSLFRLFSQISRREVPKLTNLTGTPTERLPRAVQQRELGVPSGTPQNVYCFSAIDY